MSDDTIELIRGVNPFPVELPAPAIEPLLARVDAEQTTPSRDRPRRYGGVILGVLATAVTVAVALAAIVLLGHGHSRQSTNQHRQPAVPAAARQLTSILGVLRRPQTAADRDPALIGQLSRGAHNKYTLGFEGRPVPSPHRAGQKTTTPQRPGSHRGIDGRPGDVPGYRRRRYSSGDQGGT
jgi:hypothetical protein